MKALLRQILERLAPRLGLTADAVDVLVAGARTELVRAERSLCPQDRSEEVGVLILDGAGRVECATPGAGAAILELVPPGHFVRVPTGRGPTAPAPGLRAVAHVDSWVAVIPAGLLVQVLGRLPGDRLFRMMAYGWRAFSRHLLDRCRMPSLPLSDRLLVALAGLGRDFGRPVESGMCIAIRVTHTQLAELVGGSRAAVCRTLGELVRQGKVAMDGDRFVLPGASGRAAAGEH